MRVMGHENAINILWQFKKKQKKNKQNKQNHKSNISTTAFTEQLSQQHGQPININQSNLLVGQLT